MLIANRLLSIFMPLFVCCVWLSFGCHRNGEKPEVLTGWVTQAELFRSVPDYQASFEDYQPDSQAVAVIREFHGKIEILVFLGTWCPDCARELPRFLKTIEVASNPNLHVRMFALDRNKMDEGGIAKSYQIEFIPTFVFSVDGQELGRLVEKAELSIEEDMALLLSEYWNN